MGFIKKAVLSVIKFFKDLRYWMDYWDIKMPAEIVGLFLALICAAVLFFLPSYDPGYNMTVGKFRTLCERHDFEMEDISENYFYVNSVVEDTHEDYTFKYYSCTNTCYAKFYAVRETNELRKQGGRERNVYNPQFQLTTFTERGRHATLYRNDTELLIVSGPTTDAETLNAILKKCRIPNV